MASGFIDQFLAESKAQIYFFEEEQILRSHQNISLITSFGFVPDHLAFDCEEGYVVIRLTKKPYQIFLGLRS
jgi:hypothetical protein